jgi:hypothetical protein
MYRGVKPSFVECHHFWPSGHVEMWPSGHLAMWPSGHLAMWPSGRLAVWPSGHLAMWPSGHLAMWPGGVLVSFSFFLQAPQEAEKVGQLARRDPGADLVAVLRENLFQRCGPVVVQEPISLTHAA